MPSHSQAHGSVGGSERLPPGAWHHPVGALHRLVSGGGDCIAWPCGCCGGCRGMVDDSRSLAGTQMAAGDLFVALHSVQASAVRQPLNPPPFNCSTASNRLTSQHNWERAEEFWPERWEQAAGPAGQPSPAGPPKAYLPFSDGGWLAGINTSGWEAAYPTVASPIQLHRLLLQPTPAPAAPHCCRATRLHWSEPGAGE